MKDGQCVYGRTGCFAEMCTLAGLAIADAGFETLRPDCQRLYATSRPTARCDITLTVRMHRGPHAHDPIPCIGSRCHQPASQVLYLRNWSANGIQIYIYNIR